MISCLQVEIARDGQCHRAMTLGIAGAVGRHRQRAIAERPRGDPRQKRRVHAAAVGDDHRATAAFDEGARERALSVRRSPLRRAALGLFPFDFVPVPAAALVVVLGIVVLDSSSSSSSSLGLLRSSSSSSSSSASSLSNSSGSRLATRRWLPQASQSQGSPTSSSSRSSSSISSSASHSGHVAIRLSFDHRPRTLERAPAHRRQRSDRL